MALKNIQCPSREKLGLFSVAGVLMVEPMFCGGPQGSLVDGRCAM